MFIFAKLKLYLAVKYEDKYIEYYINNNKVGLEIRPGFVREFKTIGYNISIDQYSYMGQITVHFYNNYLIKFNIRYENETKCCCIEKTNIVPLNLSICYSKEITNPNITINYRSSNHPYKYNNKSLIDAKYPDYISNCHIQLFKNNQIKKKINLYYATDIHKLVCIDIQVGNAYKYYILK